MDTTNQSKSILKKGLLVLLAIFMFISIIQMRSLSVVSNATEIVDSGNCGIGGGDNVVWELDSDGTLTISGTGMMASGEWNKDSVNTVIMNEGITIIYSDSFRNCTNLTDVTFPNSLVQIYHSAFYGCKKLASVDLPVGVKSIDYGVFAECSNLTSVTIPRSVTYIGNGAFYNCSNLANVFISDIKSWCGIDFQCDDGSLISNADYSSNPLYYAHHLFLNGNEVTDLVIPNTVTRINPWAFVGCESFTSITIPDNLGYIGGKAFYKCINIKRVNIYDLKSWCEMCFGNEYSNPLTYARHIYLDGQEITNLTIPADITSIGAYAFYECSGLTSVAIPEGIESIDNHAFYGCYNLSNIQLPDSLTTIGGSVFRGCSKLRIKLPKNLIGIGGSAFYGCVTISSLDIPESIQYIGERAFYNCRFSNITIPDGITTIENYTFEKCSNLTSVVIPTSVTRINVGAFNYCSHLSDVYYTGSKAEWNNIYINTSNGNDPFHHSNWYLQKANMHYNYGHETDDPITKTVSFVIGETTGTVDLTFDPSWVVTNSSTYQHDLARFCSHFAMIGYVGQKKVNQLESALEVMGFSDIVDNLDTGRDEVNYFIASKMVTVNGEKSFVVFMGLIGSNKTQWNSDFDPYGNGRIANGGNGYSGICNKRTVHLGFEDAKQYAYLQLFDYINCIYHDPTAKTKIILTGHSRGAAAANLLAKDLIDSSEFALPEDIYTYTFATPNNVKNPSRNEKYDRIFNIVNPTDFVTKVLPTDWNFSRYGTTFALPTRNNIGKKAYNEQKNRMLTAFYRYTDNSTYDDYELGELPVWNVITRMTLEVWNLTDFYYKPVIMGNMGNIYWYFQNVLCPFVNDTGDASKAAAGALALSLMAADPSQIGLFSRITGFFFTNTIFNGFNGNFVIAHEMQTYSAYLSQLSEEEITKPKSSIYFKVNCPVNVEVYDENGQLVGRIINNTIDETIFQSDNAISIYVDGDEKTFIIPSDCDYTVKYIGNDIGVMDLTIGEFDEDLEEVIRVNFYDIDLNNGKTYTGEIIKEDENIVDYELLEDTGEIINSDEVINNEDSIKHRIEIYGNKTGELTETLLVTSGDYITITPELNNCEVFKGWYIGDELLSEEQTYRFRPSFDSKITAVIITEHAYEEISVAATCTTQGYTSKVCSACGDTLIVTTYNALGHDYTAIVTPPTCISNGFTKHTCTRCGDSYTSNNTPALKHEDFNGDGYCDYGCGTYLGEPSTPGEQDDVCKYCGKVHTGPLGGIIKFFHNIAYFFAHLFGRK